jgi:mannose/cellobiose epimerase-like protein (N-acyl-D-glucosamine 2-epimerase family)
MPFSPPDDTTPHGEGRFADPLSAEHQAWLAAERDRLWRFGAASVVPDGGFGWLDDTGRVDPTRPLEAWISCRMTHVAALEVLAGRAEAAPVLDHGVRTLETTLHDTEHDGWYAAVGPGASVTAEKRAYEHAFVLLAATGAVAAGHPRGERLLDHAREVFDTHFWADEEGMAVDVWSRGWDRLEDYRGANANMHGVEAMLAVHDLTGDRTWLERATRVTERLVHEQARSHDWLLPEHYTPSWQPVLDYNRDEPAHPFRPYGATTGHLLEWARLTLHLRQALGAQAPSWTLDAARELFATAVDVGWDVDGAEGFVYTTDFTGSPVVRTRLHWVVAEAIAAAYTLWDATGEDGYRRWYATWWDYADRRLIDLEGGSWRHELDEHNRPAASVWQGKPDVYHAYQAALLPSLGPISSFAGALGRRDLG